MGIPESTLRYRINKGEVADSLGRWRPTFDREEERSLVNKLNRHANTGFPMRKRDFLRLSTEFAKQRNIAVRSDSLTNHWWRGFQERNKNEICIKRTAYLSAARATWQPEKTQVFFENLRTINSLYKFGPESIYNCDETGISSVPSQRSHVIVSPKSRPITIKSAERGITTTVMCCVSAAGSCIPPMFIFRGVRKRTEFIKDGPPGCVVEISSSGWMESDTFVKYCEHFVTQSGASKTNRKLLIMDNLAAHLSLQALDFMDENGVSVLTLPPHSSAKMQPLDVTFF